MKSLTLPIELPVEDTLAYLLSLKEKGRDEDVQKLLDLMIDEINITYSRMENAENMVENLQAELNDMERMYKYFMPLEYQTFETPRDAAYAVVSCLPRSENPLIQDDEQYIDEGNEYWRAAIKYFNLDTEAEGWYSVIGQVLEGNNDKFIVIRWSFGCDFDRSKYLERQEKNGLVQQGSGVSESTGEGRDNHPDDHPLS